MHRRMAAHETSEEHLTLLLITSLAWLWYIPSAGDKDNLSRERGATVGTDRFNIKLSGDCIDCTTVDALSMDDLLVLIQHTSSQHG